MRLKAAALAVVLRLWGRRRGICGITAPGWEGGEWRMGREAYDSLRRICDAPPSTCPAPQPFFDQLTKKALPDLSTRVVRIPPASPLPAPPPKSKRRLPHPSEILFHELWHICATLVASKSCALPDAARKNPLKMALSGDSHRCFAHEWYSDKL